MPKVQAKIVRDGLPLGDKVGIFIQFADQNMQEVIRLDENEAKHLRNRLNTVLSEMQRKHGHLNP